MSGVRSWTGKGGSRRPVVDVCLILEGTYPYITGGVAAWVQSLLTGLPDLTFAIVHLSAGDNQPSHARYTLPPNLVEIVDWPLDVGEARVWRNKESGRQESHLPLSPAPLLPISSAPVHPCTPAPPLPCPPAPLPDARLYHALSTGFAGLLGCQVKQALGRPLILTEHGIYWREVQAGAYELECGFQIAPIGQDGIGLQALRDHWRVALQDAARQAYAQADVITTVCQANARLQFALGAPPLRCHVIPNAVDWPALAPKEPRVPVGDGAYRIGFIGRVVSIKDVATFLEACQLVASALPGAEFYVIGPLDHDPAYATRCRQRAADLGLGDQVTFTGETDPGPWYRRLDVVVLTSLSEGQPLVLLEAMAAGVPVVATAVGGCPELVLGATRPDQALGPAGILTPVRDPGATARAILALCRDVGRWRQASRAGQERVRRYYSLDQLRAAYRMLYARASDYHGETQDARRKT
ncbi:MAG: GT4 family glycosyltransferase PelF [Anaerolineae bacterium]